MAESVAYSLGGEIHGVSIDIPSEPSHFSAVGLMRQITDHRVDIRDGKSLNTLVEEIQPDFVFHLAAQALVRPAYKNPTDG